MVPLFGFGLPICAEGIYLETRNPKTEEEDSVAWKTMAKGAFVIGCGLALAIRNYKVAIAFALLSPGLVFGLMCFAYWGWIMIYIFLRGVRAV
jgi:hypothetical protein